MQLIITSSELTLLRKAAEGTCLEEFFENEKLTKKEIEKQLKTILKKLKADSPVGGLQVLAQTNFKVVD